MASSPALHWLPFSELRLKFVCGRGFIQLLHHIAAMDPHLIELKELANSLLIASFRGIQQLTAMVHLFFFGMGSSPSFHSHPFVLRGNKAPARRSIAEILNFFQIFQPGAGTRRGRDEACQTRVCAPRLSRQATSPAQESACGWFSPKRIIGILFLNH